jgi:uncharacterized membrane protein
MRRLLDIRIIRWELKLLYVIGAIGVGFVLAGLLRAWGMQETVAMLTTSTFDVAALLLGARLFRGSGEAIEPPRPWWRMTARPTLSRRLGILFVVLAVFGAVATVLTAVGEYTPAPGVSLGEAVFGSMIGVLEFTTIAYLYLNSAVRLKRMGVPPKAPKPPKFRPTVKLG